jgi:hypothetical protein
MSLRGDWLIAKSAAVAPPQGSTFDAAYLVRVARGAATRDVIVEFADPAAVASIGYAEEVTRPFLCDLEPPRHLVVDQAGAVRVQSGPRDATGDDDGDESAASAVSSPRRARNRRRGSVGL